jgi:hypothetical protein
MNVQHCWNEVYKVKIKVLGEKPDKSHCVYHKSYMFCTWRLRYSTAFFNYCLWTGRQKSGEANRLILVNFLSFWKRQKKGTIVLLFKKTSDSLRSVLLYEGLLISR